MVTFLYFAKSDLIIDTIINFLFGFRESNISRKFNISKIEQNNINEIKSIKDNKQNKININNHKQERQSKQKKLIV
jgi:hypothetical protein